MFDRDGRPQRGIPERTPEDAKKDGHAVSIIVALASIAVGVYLIMSAAPEIPLYGLGIGLGLVCAALGSALLVAVAVFWILSTFGRGRTKR